MKKKNQTKILKNSKFKNLNERKMLRIWNIFKLISTKQKKTID